MEKLITKSKLITVCTEPGYRGMRKRVNYYFFVFMERVIADMSEIGRIRTSETYATTLRSLKRFLNGRDLPVSELDSDCMVAYEAYLKQCGVSPNTSSFYMRNLRAVYNRAVERNLTPQRYPFRHVYTGVDKTVKRALPARVIRQLKCLDLSASPSLQFARDMFLFSFYTRGMSFVDMAYLRKKDLSHGFLTYCRRKTRQQLTIKWEGCMQQIVDRYCDPDSPYLLPIIRPEHHLEIRNQYIYASSKVNKNLKIIGGMLNLHQPLTLYVSRHSWASIAKSMDIPLSVICEGMGHDSEATTRIYLASLNTTAVDKANLKILKLL